MTVIRATIALLFAAITALSQTAPDAGRLAKLPIRFKPNVGQAPAGVPFVARGTGYSLSLRGERAEFVFRSGDTQARLEMQLVGARAGRPMTPSQKLPGVSNYLLSPARGGAKENVPTYGRVTAPGIYPGIDVTYYGSGQELEHDFVVSPQADPGLIRMRYSDGAAPPRPARLTSGYAVTQELNAFGQAKLIWITLMPLAELVTKGKNLELKRRAIAKGSQESRRQRHQRRRTGESKEERQPPIYQQLRDLRELQTRGAGDGYRDERG